MHIEPTDRQDKAYVKIPKSIGKKSDTILNWTKDMKEYFTQKMIKNLWNDVQYQNKTTLEYYYIPVRLKF